MSEISIFNLRVPQVCVHFIDGGDHPNVKGVQFLDNDHIEFYCENCIKKLKENGFSEKSVDTPKKHKDYF